ncbi:MULTISPECIES: carboxymuconolactone decarboxylase family protein [Paenibacillus]|uniref:Carboxymuconolactone decarboxylase family protein n=1 Tax=Paenibacillus anseongense TaxID=2682845 RepID=A0ABW9UH44_9BACL|nr:MULTISPECIES: carboxymuconolactone decarboxylase family protein [Paenibacillus]MBA2941982.1 carboxymuconolactone decarboxylase family protein [Paenibacillus sp. CGMCC 1.16610]MVQ38498.1 carboxymuconolactone decarboxylase family protein [Paenibacillus anseongense]
MEIRLDYTKVQPESLQTLLKLEGYVKKSGLDGKLVELIKIRASQINGCAYCLDMHTKDARAMGETEQRIYLLNAWREAPFYTPSERAALALTEAVTRISNAGVPDDLYDQVRRHFDEEQYVDLIMAINAINSWNRMAISTGMVPGDYQPPASK